jgi:hypothetical protein
VTIIVLMALVIGVCSVLLCLSQIYGPQRAAGAGHGLRPPQIKLWHVMAAVIASALLVHIFTARGPEQAFPSMMLLCLGFLGWFVRIWQKEFVFLMGLRDDQFPGRLDKLIWVAVVLLLAPFGVWFFRAYRLAHWPEPAIGPERGMEEAAGTATRTA